MRNLVFSIHDFSVKEHLSKIIEIGCKTAEFATGKKIVFWSPETLKLWKLQNGGPMLVAVDNNSEIIGFLLATFHESGIATLENLYVANSHRRQGVANKLLDELERRATYKNIKTIRSFGHVTNKPMSYLLIQQGYSDSILTQWYSGQPQSMNLIKKEPLNKRISVRQIQSSDLGSTKYLALLDNGLAYNTPCGNEVTFTDWLNSNQIMYGTFHGDNLVGLAVASVHEPTNKVTIERILVDKSFTTPSIIKSLLIALLQKLAMQGIFYVTIHPSINDVSIPSLNKILVSLDFEKRLIFQVNCKTISMPTILWPSNHLINLSLKDYESLFVGSAFFACGGGVPYTNSISLMNSSSQKMDTNLVSLDGFSPNDWLCTVYAIGASGHGQKQYTSFLLAIECLEQHLGIKIKGIIPGEIGSEINAVWTANQRQIALVDADMVGGRAVPEEQMDLYGFHNITTTPVILVNDKADVIVVKNANDLLMLESIYRAFAIASGGYCYIASRPIKQVDAKAILLNGTISKALDTGQKILSCATENQIINILKDSCNSKLLAKGKIVANTLNDMPGFLSGVVQINGSEEYSNKKFEIHYKNENIIMLCNNEYVCSMPDLISIIDAKSLMPVSNSLLQKNSDVLVFGTPALPLWQTTKGVAILGPAQFGFNYEYKPIGNRNKTT